MTQQLQEAWKVSSKPFHDRTVYIEDLVRIEPLQKIVSSVVRHIELYYASNSLFLFDDWHAHDGFITTPKPLTIAELVEHAATADSLYKWRHGDFAVHRSVYPETFDFLLRVKVLDEDEDLEQYPGIWGSFSFTGYGFDIAEIRKRALDFPAIGVAEDNSKAYFDRIYAG